MQKIIYRGPLSSCNYHCSYCPFAKKRASKEQLLADERDLLRFVAWLKQEKKPRDILFTPWGEALIWPYYQRAIIELSHQEHIKSITIQTNLSGSLAWLNDCVPQKTYLWASYHPDETELKGFLQQCRRVLQTEVNLNVGMVALREYFPLIAELSKLLPDSVYLWLNAYKDVPDYYDQDDIVFLQNYDEFFIDNLTDHESQGRICASGDSVFTVDGKGDMRACHFISDIIGNIYDKHYEQGLKSRTCSEAQCICYIGYIHLTDLNYAQKFGPHYFQRHRTTRHLLKSFI